MRMKREKAMIPPTTSGPRLWTAEAVLAHAREAAGLPPDAELSPPARPPEPAATLRALYARDAEAAEQARGTAARTYRTVLDTRARALTGRPILEAMEIERRDLAKCDEKIRAALLAYLDKYPAPPPTARKIIADQVRALRQQAQGALDTLDRNPGLLASWIEKITTIPGDVGSARYLAEQHWTDLQTLLDRARGLLAVPKDLTAAAQALEMLSAKLLTHGAPVELPRGSGPLPESLEKPTARGAYRAETAVRHD